MTPVQISALVAFLGSSAMAAEPASGRSGVEAGAYQVAYRLELPHVERWAIDRSRTICVPVEPRASEPPLPVLSGNTPFGSCATTAFRTQESSLAFALTCAGRDSARARAVFKLVAGGFEGRITMIMGAKNMTMTEVQIGRRIGSCPQIGTRD